MAPSAENLQPWKFRSDGEVLTLYFDRTRHLASDIDGMLALTGLGACLENALIAALEQGYETQIDLEARPEMSLASADLIQIASLHLFRGAEVDPLFEYIDCRCTSRRMKASPQIPDEHLGEIFKSTVGIQGVRVDWVQNRSEIRQLAQLIGVGNRIRFEFQPFHSELYHSLRFSESEVEQTRDGLDVATLQLPRGIGGLMYALRFWPRMASANRIGFSRGVARQASHEVQQSAALGVLTVDKPTTESFLCGGRAFQRLWLAATSLGLAVHPTASLPVFLAYARQGAKSQLLESHQRMAQQMSRQFDYFMPNLSGRSVQMVFRLGHGEPPDVRSLRRPVKDVLEFEHALS